MIFGIKNGNKIIKLKQGGQQIKNDKDNNNSINKEQIKKYA